MSAPINHPTPDTFGRIGEQRDADPDPQPAPVAVSSEQQRIADLESRLEQSDERLSQALSRPAASPTQATVPAQNLRIPDPGRFEGDPGAEPQRYLEYQEHVRQYERQVSREELAQTASTATNQVRSAQIIDAYMAARPQYLGMRELVTVQFRLAMRDLQLSALPEGGEESQLYSTVDSKMTAVAKQFSGSTAAAGAGDETTPQPAPGRTAGVSAGSGVNTPSAHVPDVDDGVTIKPLDDVFKSHQSEGGFF